MSKKFSDIVKIRSSELIEEGRMTDNTWIAWQYGIKQGPHETRDHYNKRMVLAGEYHKAFSDKKKYIDGSQVGIIDYTLGGYYKFKSIKPENIDSHFASSTGSYDVPIANFDHRIDYKVSPENQTNFFIECAKRFQPSDSKMMAYDKNRYGTNALSSVNNEGIKARIALDFSGAPDPADDRIICFAFAGNAKTDPNSYMNLTTSDQEKYYAGVFSIFNEVGSHIIDAINAIRTDVAYEVTYFTTPGSMRLYPDRSDASIGTEATVARYMELIAPAISSASSVIKMYIESMIKQNVDRKSINTLDTWIKNVDAALSASPPLKFEDKVTKFVLAFGIPLYPTVKNDDLVNLYFNAVRSIGSDLLNLTKINDDLIFVTDQDRKELEDRIQKKYPWLIGKLNMFVANAIFHPLQTYDKAKTAVKSFLNRIHNAANNGPLRYH